MHLAAAADLRDALRTGRLWAPFTDYHYYPPLVHTVLAVAFLAFGSSWRLALAVGALWQVLLFVSARRLGRCLRLGGPARAMLLAVLMGSPLLIGNGRELQLDVAVLAMLVTLGASLRGVDTRTRPATHAARWQWARPITVVALGTLTKWSFVGFAAPMVAAELLVRRRWMRRYRTAPPGGPALTPAPTEHATSHAAHRVPRPAGSWRRSTWPVAAVAAVLAAWSWYVLNLSALLWDYQRFGVRAGIVEGDPQGIGWQSLRYYLLAFLTQYSGVPALLVAIAVGVGFVTASARAWRGRRAVHRGQWPTAAQQGRPAPADADSNLTNRRWLMCTAALMTIVGGAGLLAQGNKDARYLAPIVFPSALVLTAMTETIDRRGDRRTRSDERDRDLGTALPGRGLRPGKRLAAAVAVAATAVTAANIVNLTLPIGGASVTVPAFGTSVPIFGATAYTRARPSSHHRVINDVAAAAVRLLDSREVDETCVGPPAIAEIDGANSLLFNKGTLAGLVRLIGRPAVEYQYGPCVIVFLQPNPGALGAAMRGRPYVEAGRWIDADTHALAVVAYRRRE